MDSKELDYARQGLYQKAEFLLKQAAGLLKMARESHEKDSEEEEENG